MARVDIKSGGTILATGLLQLQNGVAMSTTLTAVTDQNNTASQLKLASNLTQVAGTLQIQTDTATYIDVEDGSGNNRFTVSRQPASQQVSVDFASVPTDLTTVVGAIRTATNGSTLANIVSFTEAGNVGFGTDTPGTKVDVHSANNTVAQFNRTGTGNSQIQHLMTGTARWTTGYVNATGNYSIYDNVNAVFRTNLSNTGKLTIGNGDTALAGQLSVKGSGSTSATTSLLVQNSAGSQRLKLADDGLLEVYYINNNPVGGFSNIPSTGNYGMIIGCVTNSGDTAIFTKGNNASSSALRVTDQDVGNSRNHLLVDYVGATGFNLPNGTKTVNASAQVEIVSTTKGFLPPRMTTAQKNAIASPTAGLMVYDTTLNKLCVYTTAWETITSI